MGHSAYARQQKTEHLINIISNLYQIIDRVGRNIEDDGIQYI